MPTDRRLAFTPNLVVGVCIMLLGIALTLDRLDVVEIRTLLHWWPLLLIVFGASLVVQAWRGEAQPGAPGSPERPIVSPGFVLFVAIFFLVATHVQRRSDVTAGDPGADRVSLFVVMSAESHTNRATRFRGAEMTSIMGRTRLDLREANLAPGDEAVIDVLTAMGRIDIQVPAGWTVDVEALRLMGRVRDERPQPAATDDAEPEAAPDALEPVEAPAEASRPPRIVVRGVVMLGGVTIRS